ncbi:unnamed protein product [Microthlaspi erraticum]|uniref:NB-ARC domain-containing protein n=1 Tax=Microthlaspi erraticum TaxID=1685480 RepID=A0A6D2KPF6_9BRAS|nr:unnamed protein product [Microthlaspi erraticum]
MDSARGRQEMKDLKLCERLVNTLGGDGPQRVVLTGRSGIGKTRLARKVGKHATKKGLCYLALWLHLNNKFEDESSLYQNIAFQIEVYDTEGKEAKKSEDFLKALKEKINAELSRRKRSAEKKMKMLMTEKNAKKLAQGEKKHTPSAVVVPYLLLYSTMKGTRPVKIREDDENTRECDEEIEPQDTNSEVKFKPDDTEFHDTKSGEVTELHNTRSEEVTETHTTHETHAGTKRDGEIEFHTTDESQALHETLSMDHLQDLFESLINDEARHLLECLQKDWKIDEALTSSVVRKSMSLPAAIVMFAKSLNCITNTFKSFPPKAKEILKEVLFPCGPADTDGGSRSIVAQHNPILHLAYALLDTSHTSKSVIVDCFWHSLDFFKHNGCVDYNHLITQWMLEGYFDPVRSVKKAYNDGHDILVELINRGILKTQEDDMVIPEMAMSNLTDLRQLGLLGRSWLPFASGDQKKSLGKIIQIDDMIKTVQTTSEEDICTILVSGNRLRRERPHMFLEKMFNLEVLGLFTPTLEPLIPSVTNLQKLRILVIRDSDLLSDIDELCCLRRLTVLEVSGASSLTAISDKFFLELTQLQSLNLSGLRIKFLPSSISQLSNLSCLILRDCPVLEDLPDIQSLKKLEVVDINGARMLKSCLGMKENTSRNRTFCHLQQLQLLDLSESKIRRLPLFHDAAVGEKLRSLRRLSLHNCSNLIRLPNLKPLSGLQILDLSGTTSLLEITEVCFEQKEKLKILNLSGTKITKVPSTISGLSSLSQLLLRDIPNLEALPNIKRLTSLEVFDVSGCTKLHKIEGSFQDMPYLREVNLSGTRIETLPELPETSNICCSKLLIQADSRSFENDTWGQVKEAVTKEISESLNTYDKVERIHEISRKESGIVDELWAFPGKKGFRREHFYKGRIYRDVYMNAIPFVDNKSCQEVLEIQGSNGVDQDKQTLAKSEFVAFVENSTANLSSIFLDLKSVKSCWLEMCGDIEILFSGVDEERLRDLETLSITNLQKLKSICSSSFKNLKKLNLDCCPSIITLFMDTSQLPSSLEVLKIKFCENLKTVFAEEVELPKLHTLCLFELHVLSRIGATLPNLVTYKEDKCPKLKNAN